MIHQFIFSLCSPQLKVSSPKFCNNSPLLHSYSNYFSILSICYSLVTITSCFFLAFFLSAKTHIALVFFVIIANDNCFLWSLYKISSSIYISIEVPQNLIQSLNLLLNITPIHFLIVLSSVKCFVTKILQKFTSYT